MPVRTRRQVRANAALQLTDEVILHVDLSQEVMGHLNLEGLLAMRCACSKAHKLADRVFSIADAKKRKDKGAWEALWEAIRQGCVFFVEVAYKQGAKPDKRSAALAARHGQLSILKLFYEHGMEWDAWTCLDAAEHGHLECVAYLVAVGCPAVWGGSDGDAFFSPCTQAAFGGHIHVLEWALDHGYACDEEVCMQAAATGRIACLEWLRDRGVACGERTCAAAAEFGQLDCLRWLRKHGCPE